jgi:hypothetical protein
VLADWSGVAQIAAGASATLLGLLFVAIQLNRDWIVKQAALRGRTLKTLLIFMLPLIAAILLAVPRQSVRILGAELVVLGILYWLGLFAVSRTKKASTPFELLLRNIGPPGLLSALLMLISGGVLLSGRLSGLYWLVAAMIVALVGGVGDAWVFLMGDSDDGTGRPRF